MARTDQAIVIGVFDNREQARKALEELRRVGFAEDQIGVAARDSDRTTVEEQGSHAGEGAVTGAVAGAGIGGLWAIGIAAGLLPAIGPIIAGGLLASILASAATGAAAGGLIGALVGLGVPEEEAQFYESEFHAGRMIVTVRADGRREEAATILHHYGAYDVNTPRPTSARPAAEPVDRLDRRADAPHSQP